MNDRELYLPGSPLMNKYDVNLFKTINIHHFNPPFGVMKENGSFKILRHAFKDKKAKIGMKPLLFNRYKERK